MNLFQVQKAFTLVETLVAVSVLLLVVVGPMAITARTTKSASFAAEQVVAQFLAQEGVELAQRLRDEELLQYFVDVRAGVTTPHAAWTVFTNPTGPYQECYAAGGCAIEIRNDGSNIGQLRVAGCAAVDACRLRLSDIVRDRARYQYGSGGSPPESPYTRIIRFAHDPGDDWVRVTSEVTWRTGSLLATQRVRVDTTLLNVYAIP